MGITLRLLQTANTNQDARAAEWTKSLRIKMLCDFVADRFLNHQWSPEQIAERAESEAGGFGLSYHTICRGMKDGQFDKRRGADGLLEASGKLRHKGRKRRKKGANDDIDENEKFSETLLKQITA